MDNIKCDKCGSLRVERYLKNQSKEPEPVTMSEFVKDSSGVRTVHAVMVYHQMVLHCR